MAKIRHVALMTEHVVELADFYKKTFEMQEVHRGQMKDGIQAIYLSDGYINLAILPARGRPEGIHHFGFEVDDLKDAADVAVNNGAKQGPKGLPRDGRFAEVFVEDPAGQRVDLSQQGWRTEPLP